MKYVQARGVFQRQSYSLAGGCYTGLSTAYLRMHLKWYLIAETLTGCSCVRKDYGFLFAMGRKYRRFRNIASEFRDYPPAYFR